jgi:hypothetical protein
MTKKTEKTEKTEKNDNAGALGSEYRVRDRPVYAWQVDEAVADDDFPKFVKTALKADGAVVRRFATKDGAAMNINIVTKDGLRTAWGGDYIVLEPARNWLFILSRVQFDNHYVQHKPSKSADK